MKTVINTRDMVICAVFAALISVFSVISVPVGEIPVTLGLFGVLFTSILLGARRGAAAVLIYLLIGIVGLPVFSGFRGGFYVLAGPTGGYAGAYALTALIAGAASDCAAKMQNPLKTILISAGTAAGIAVCYACGAAWFAALTGASAAAAVAEGVLPFVLFDAAKAIAAVICAAEVSKRIKF